MTIIAIITTSINSTTITKATSALLLMQLLVKLPPLLELYVLVQSCSNFIAASVIKLVAEPS
jgi:hypothetical protein